MAEMIGGHGLDITKFTCLIATSRPCTMRVIRCAERRLSILSIHLLGQSGAPLNFTGEKSILAKVYSSWRNHC